MGFIPKTAHALRKKNKANIKDTKYQRYYWIRLRISPRRLTAAIRLINANLFAANLTNATFNDDANLTGANFNTSTGLTWGQISKAIISKTTKLQPELEEWHKAEQGEKAAVLD